MIDMAKKQVHIVKTVQPLISMTGTDKEPAVSKKLQTVLILTTNTELKPAHTNQTETPQPNMTGMVQKSALTRQIPVVLQHLTINTAAKQDHLKQILRAEQPTMTDMAEKSEVINNLQ